MKVSLLISCEYWEADSSRYRLALTNEMLIPSLRHEDLSDVSFWLRQTAMDPRWTARREAFEFLGRPVKHRGQHPPWRVAKEFRPIVEIECPDDVAFVPGFLSGLRDLARKTTENTTIHFTGGILWEDGECRQATGAGVRVRILVDDLPWKSVVRECQKTAWCVARHQMNDPWVDRLKLGAPVASSLPSICEATLGRYCRLQVATGTAAGATRFWHRGRSMILAAKHKGRRSP